MSEVLSNQVKGKIGELEVIKTLLSWGLEVYIAAIDEKHTDILIRRETTRKPYLRLQVKARFYSKDKSDKSTAGEFPLDKYFEADDFWFVLLLKPIEGRRFFSYDPAVMARRNVSHISGAEFDFLAIVRFHTQLT